MSDVEEHVNSSAAADFYYKDRLTADPYKIIIHNVTITSYTKKEDNESFSGDVVFISPAYNRARESFFSIHPIDSGKRIAHLNKLRRFLYQNRNSFGLESTSEYDIWNSISNRHDDELQYKEFKNIEIDFITSSIILLY